MTATPAAGFLLECPVLEFGAVPWTSKIGCPRLKLVGSRLVNFRYRGFTSIGFLGNRIGSTDGLILDSLSSSEPADITSINRSLSGALAMGRGAAMEAARFAFFTRWDGV